MRAHVSPCICHKALSALGEDSAQTRMLSQPAYWGTHLWLLRTWIAGLLVYVPFWREGL